MRSNTLLISVAALFVAFPSLAPAVEIPAIPVLPTVYRVGPQPIDAGTSFYLTWLPATSASIADISDSSLDTFTKVDGIDGGLASHGGLEDIGTFYFLQYQIDPNAVSSSIDFTAKLDPYPVSAGQFTILAMSADNTKVLGGGGVNALQPTMFGLEFFRDSDTGTSNVSLGSMGSNRVDLNTMLAPDGHLTIVLLSALGNATDEPGHVTSYLYDVNASYSVPEPGTMCIFATAVIPFLRFRNRGRSSRLTQN